MSAPARSELLRDGRWEVDPAGTRAAFRVRDVLHRPVTGTLEVTDGRVDVVDGVPVRVEARLDLAGVDTGNARRDHDLRGRRFFDVDGSAVLAFSGGPARAVSGGWELPGTLVLRDVRCPVRLAVEVDPHDDGVQVRATATLDRRELGIRVPRVLVGSQVHLTITAVLRPPELPPA